MCGNELCNRNQFQIIAPFSVADTASTELVLLEFGSGNFQCPKTPETLKTTDIKMIAELLTMQDLDLVAHYFRG